MKVAELYAGFRIQIDHKSLNRAMAGIRAIRYGALGLSTVFGIGAIAKGMIGFNQRVEDAKLGIAGMLALAKGQGTTVASQLQVASGLYDDIRKKASEFPGTTEEYVTAMQKLTLPILSAGGSLQDLKDMTVATIVAAKGGVGGATAKTAITDVLQGIEGRFATTDFFLKAVLGGKGSKWADEAGRKLFRSLSKKERFLELKKALENPVFRELAEKQSQTFTGQMDKMKEAAAQFLGGVGLPLFAALTEKMKQLNKWVAANQESIKEFATSLGEKIAKGLGAIVSVFEFLTSGSETAKSVLLALKLVAIGVAASIAVSWLIAFGPMILVVGRLFLLIELFKKLRDTVGTVTAVMATAFSGALLFNIGGITTKLKDLVKGKLGMGVGGMAAAATGKIMNVSVINAGVINAGMGGMGGIGGGAFGTPAAGGGSKLGNAARGLMGGLPYIGLAVAGHEAMDKFLPKEGALGKVASVGKWLASGPIALPKFAIGKVWDAVQGEQGTLRGYGQGQPTTINAPLTVTITGVESPEEFAQKMVQIQDEMNRKLMDAFSGGQR